MQWWQIWVGFTGTYHTTLRRDQLIQERQQLEQQRQQNIQRMEQQWQQQQNRGSVGEICEMVKPGYLTPELGHLYIQAASGGGGNGKGSKLSVTY